MERLLQQPNELFRPFKERMADLALDTIRRDNEANAVFAIKVSL
jgi:hypothetical protein